MELSKIRLAKYSVLIATKEIEIEYIKKLLDDGLKVILFCDEKYIDKFGREFENFIKADFFNVFRNINKIELLYVDGKNVNIDELIELEIGDTSFNKEQYLIEHESPDNNIIVEAGAGTGKTHVMINRIMYLMHVDPNFNFSKVAMITFTNKATDNMRHRLVDILEKKYILTRKEKYLDKIEELSCISISTIHSFFKKIIVEVGPILGYGKNVQLRSYVLERKELLRDIINKQFKGNGRVEEVIGLPLHYLEKLAIEYWEKLDNNGISSIEIENLYWGSTSNLKAKRIQTSLKDIFENVDEKYNEIKYINNAISMKDIIHELSRVINNPEIRDYIVQNYKYMFCDEFQDSDNVQIQTISILNRVYGGKLFVVGDVKQSIYRFRGATDSAFTKLKDMLTDEEKDKLIVRSLTKNYRTSECVLNKLDTIFEYWGDSSLKLLRYETDGDHNDRLVPQNKELGIYKQIVIKEEEREKKTIEIIKEIQSKSNNKRITCLTRKNSQLILIKRWCEKEKLVCLIKEKGSFYKSEAVLDFCALIEGFLYENEPMFLYNYIRSSYGRGIVDYAALVEADGEKTRILEVLSKEIDIEQWNMYKTDLRYKPVLAVLRDMVEKYNPVKEFGLRRKQILLDNLFPEDKAVEQTKIDCLQYDANLKKLLQILTNQFSRDFTSLVDICEFLRLKILTDNNEEPAEIEVEKSINFVEGMTVHGAKGLEFENVLIPFMNDTFFQKFKSEILISRDRKKVGWIYRKKGEDEVSNDLYSELYSEEEDEVAKEETRLLYVAMTRAKLGLYCFVIRKNTEEYKTQKWADLLPKENDNEKCI